MENKYKEFIVNRLYGLMGGSPKSLENLMNDNFKTLFGFKPDSLIVNSTDRIIEDEYMKGSWIGTMTTVLIINKEEYSITRDWGEEYDNDKQHVKFKTDDYFYEGDYCYSYKKSQEILKNIGLEEKMMCDFCKVNESTGVYATDHGPFSLAYCDECLDHTNIRTINNALSKYARFDDEVAFREYYDRYGVEPNVYYNGKYMLLRELVKIVDENDIEKYFPKENFIYLLLMDKLRARN